MLHTLLVILKIIGILFAILIGLILLCILLVLFCPARYQINGEYRGALRLRAKVTFLMPLLSAVIDYSNGINTEVRILGFPIIPKNRRDKPSKKKKVVPSDKSSGKQNATIDVDNTPNTASNQNEDSNRNTDTKRYEYHNQNAGNKRKKGSPYSMLKRKIIHMKEVILDFFRSITQAFRKARILLSDLSAFPSNIKVLFDDEGAKRGWTFLIEEISLLLKKGRPKKIRWFLRIGTGDPCLTGQILGLLGVLYARWGKGMQIEPDFEEPVFETDFFCKGKIRGIHVLRFTLKIIFHKDIKYLREEMQNLRRS